MPGKKKHRERKSPRTKGWDYSQTATYFVTICTKNRIPFLGAIKNGMMGFSETGLVINRIWLYIARQFPHVELDEYIVMPNHVHGILTIYDQRNKNNRDAINRVPEKNRTTKKGRSPMDGDGINNSINQPGGATGRNNPMLTDGNLGKVIRWFKGRCTYEVRQLGYQYFQWQGRYWDQIIENDQALTHIRKYIYDNPLNWKTDHLYGID